MTWLPAAKIAHKGEKVRFTGKFQGEIMPTVPRGSYLTKALPPNLQALVLTQVYNPYLYGDKIISDWSLKFNVVDLELGRNFFLSQFLTMRPHL